jgi:hypothetical protein
MARHSTTRKLGILVVKVESRATTSTSIDISERKIATGGGIISSLSLHNNSKHRWKNEGWEMEIKGETR